MRTGTTDQGYFSRFFSDIVLFFSDIFPLFSDKNYQAYRDSWCTYTQYSRRNRQLREKQSLLSFRRVGWVAPPVWTQPLSHLWKWHPLMVDQETNSGRSRSIIQTSLVTYEMQRRQRSRKCTLMCPFSDILICWFRFAVCVYIYIYILVVYI